MPARFPEMAHKESPLIQPPLMQVVPPEMDPPISLNAPWPPGEEVVISGLSARLPESANIDEFREQLFAGVDLITDDERRWPSGLHGLPTRTGKIKELDKFDATFFGVHAKQAHVMDPQLRMLLELTHEAIVDAGVNPSTIRGSRTGVFIGVSASESDEFWTSDPDQVNGYGLTGCCRAMFPNRISFTFDFKGPSYAIDTACSSSLFALQQAVSAMRTGQCDAAIVGGVNLLLKPTCSLQFHRLGMLSPQGMCKAFDASGNGYVRSEAAVVIYLQKASFSKRVYATIVNARTNTDGNKEQGITYPSGAVQKKLILETYAEAGVSPADVAYVEAHGTGTKVGDPQEVNSIADVFCKGRNTPLLIGSVKSNMGHSEPASGLCSIAKTLIAMESGVIPANLHFQNPNKDIPALNDGRLKVVSENTPFPGGYVAINSFGFGGANAHIILKSNPKPKPSSTPLLTNPTVVAVSGRTEEAVQEFLKEVEKNQTDPEFVALINDIHSQNIQGHEFRGYTVIGTDQKNSEVMQWNQEKRPVWYVFSGMGSQWAGMAKELMKLEPFQAGIRRCHDALKTQGLDLIDTITNGDDETFENVLNSFVSIAAVQVALVDVLSSLGIHPDGILGHSVGELGCAYADGTFTAEQTVLAAYWRGRCILESKLPRGGMAAVGLDWETVKARCPPGIVGACHNSGDSVTISGPAEDITKFVKVLSDEGIFAKEVKSNGVAFHSRYIAEAAPKLRAYLDKVITNPKPRSARWISSSIPEESWGSELARTSSAAYHVNNLVSPVLFAEALLHVPENAVVIEIAPHCLLQAVLRRSSLHPSCLNVGLVRRGHPDNRSLLLSNIGKLYAAGLQPKLGRLSPVRPSYPVSRGTRMIAPIVRWDHSQEWNVANFGKNAGRSGECVVEVDLAKEGDAFYAGHCIDGRVLFPATGYLTLVWKMFAKLQGKSPEDIAVVMEDIQFHRATIMPKEGSVKFLITIFDSTGQFELSEGGSVAVSGKIRQPEEPQKEFLNLTAPTPPKEKEPLLPLATNDIYKELRLRGYDYAGIFQGIMSAENRGTTGNLAWAENWVSFMDCMLQFSILGQGTRDLYLPTRLQRAFIDPAKHRQAIAQAGDKGVPAIMFRDINTLQCGGVELRGLKASLAPRRTQPGNEPSLEKYVFAPFENCSEQSKAAAMQVCVHVALENTPAMKIKAVEVVPNTLADPDDLLTTEIVNILDREPMIHVEMSVNGAEVPAELESFGVKSTDKIPADGSLHMIVSRNVLSAPAQLSTLAGAIKAGGFIILREDKTPDNQKLSLVEKAGLTHVATQTGTKGVIVLLRKPLQGVDLPAITVRVNGTKFEWVELLKNAMLVSEKEGRKVYVVAEGEEISGVVGMINCLKQEPGGVNLRCIFVPQTGALPKFQSATDAKFAPQLKKDLLMNIFQNGAWGSFRHIPLSTNGATLNVEHAYINAMTRGDLASLKWIEGPLTFYKPESHPDSELCTVYYAPLNFRDIMLASGKLPPDALPGDLAGQDCILGLEFSGRGADGRRVMGMVPARSLATTVLADPGFLWEVPANWSLEDAATVPVVYATSYYALVVRGRMQPGETVLIHAGTGGVGQAAIAIALSMGCKVFTTVGSPEKRQFLLKRFPQLTEANIANSRDTTFEQHVMSATGGRGVDLVLNSLAEEKLQASVRCLAYGARFLEIGKLDFSNNNPLGMAFFLKNTTFHGILLDALFDSSEADKRQLVTLLNEGIKSGAVRPLPATVYSESQVEQAFRFMGSGKHIGKVLLKVRSEEKSATTKPATRTVNAIPRSYMNPDKSYVLVGGLGGFGLELANWLAFRGAKNIVLTSRSGVRTGYQSLCVRRWRDAGVNVLVSTTDCTTAAGAAKLLKEAATLGPIGGIFNLAAVLKDAFMENQSSSEFTAVYNPKAAATIALDSASRTLCPELDYFVAFSSVSCGRGNAGQSNYGLANSVLERVCELRQQSGLPGLAIQWGAIGDVGLIMDSMGGNNDSEVGGTKPQRLVSCLQSFDLFLQQPDPVLASMLLADKRGNAAGSSGVTLIQAVANILGVKDPNSVSQTISLADLGMDSLMGAEIKQTLERGYDVVLSAQDIRGLNFAKLIALQNPGAETATPASPKAAATNGNSTNGTSTNGAANGDVQVQFNMEQVMPKEMLVRLPSKAAATSKAAPLFIVHPIEGGVGAIEPLAAKLEVPVWGLQCTVDAPLTSIPDLAKHYIKVIKKVSPKGPYSLAGYSFGACVAFEMGLQLEKAGEKVRLALLDGSPSYVASHTGSYKARQARASSPKRPENQETEALLYFLSQFKEFDLTQVKDDLVALPTLEARVNRVSNIIAGNKGNKVVSEVAQAADSFYKKLVVADSYKPSAKFLGETTLLRVDGNYLSMSEDYGLSNVCKQKVAVHTIKGNHRDLVQGCSSVTADFINTMLKNSL